MQTIYYAFNWFFGCLFKEEVLKLLDESVYDKEKKELLNQVVLEAIEKW